MTAQELVELETRLLDANNAKQKVNRIKETIDKINEGNVARINIVVAKDYEGREPITYLEKLDAKMDRWLPVCWAWQHLPGIAFEIREAIQGILDRRLAEAVKEFEST